MGLAENDFVKQRMAPPLQGMELPSPQTKRWVPRRKAQVVAAVRSGVLSLDEACQRYALTVEEFLSWQRALDRFGLDGLCVTHAQEHRMQDNRGSG